MIHDISVIAHSRQNSLGETPIYCDLLDKLIWVDILNHTLFLMDISTEVIEENVFPFLVSAALPTNEKNILLLVSIKGIYTYDIRTKTIKDKLSNYPEPYTRPNEAQISPEGDLYFGTMDPQAIPGKGSWYFFSSEDDVPTRLSSNASIPNTIAFLDEKIIFGDTPTERLFSIPKESKDWSIKCPITKPIPGGGMDGSYLSESGHLITARWGHSKATVLDTSNEMKISDEFDLPVFQPTSCAVVGNGEENRIYFTSATLRIENPSENDGKIVSAKTTYKQRTINRFKLI